MDNIFVGVLNETDGVTYLVSSYTFDGAEIALKRKMVGIIMGNQQARTESELMALSYEEVIEELQSFRSLTGGEFLDPFIAKVEIS